MPTYFEFDIELLEIQPRIWRRFQLNSRSSFEVLHDAIQDSFGWQRRHLYEFRHWDAHATQPGAKTPVRRIARCRQAEILDDEIVPFVDEVQLSSFFAEEGNQCLYLYDFGDGWQHLVQLMDVVETNDTFERRLLDGAMACPPEDCGGPIGYEELLEFLELTEDEIAQLDSGLKNEVEWHRQKYGCWDASKFDLASMRQAFDSSPSY